MAFINGRWVEDRPVFGGMLGGFNAGFGGQDRGPRPPFTPPTGQQPIYDRGPQMQPPQMYPPIPIPPRIPPPEYVQPGYPDGPPSVARPAMPPQNVGWNTGAVSNVLVAEQAAARAMQAAAEAQRMPTPTPSIGDSWPRTDPPQVRPPMPPQPPTFVTPVPDPPTRVRPVLPPIDDIVRPPMPPEITIVDPPRVYEPPKKIVARGKVKKTRRPNRGPTPPPATRAGRTQEGRGPKGPRTITGVGRSQNTQRGDR